MVLSVALQVAVVYVPVLQQAFGTVGLSAGDWLRCIAIASSVLWLREIGKLFTRLHQTLPVIRPSAQTAGLNDSRGPLVCPSPN